MTKTLSELTENDYVVDQWGNLHDIVKINEETIDTYCYHKEKGNGSGQFIISQQETYNTVSIEEAISFIQSNIRKTIGAV